jgi:dihydrofolate reductase
MLPTAPVQREAEMRFLTPQTAKEQPVSDVFVHATMSLDGFIAGANGEMDWIFEHAGDVPDGVVEAVIARAGALLGGRRGYDIGRKAPRPEMRKLFGGRWSGPQFILTHTAPTDETDPTYTFLSGDISEAVATARTAAGDRDLLILGAEVVNQCLSAGLVDEILIHLVPELLGDGVRLFAAPGLRASLQTLEAGVTGQVANLRYRVAR